MAKWRAASGTFRPLRRPMDIMRDSRLVIHVLLIALAASAQSGPKIDSSKKTTPSATQSGRGGDWLRWVGKNRDFLVASSGLADSWPAAGPKKLWSRRLGGWFSSNGAQGAS